MTGNSARPKRRLVKPGVAASLTLLAGALAVAALVGCGGNGGTTTPTDPIAEQTRMAEEANGTEPAAATTTGSPASLGRTVAVTVNNYTYDVSMAGPIAVTKDGIAPPNLGTIVTVKAVNTSDRVAAAAAALGSVAFLVPRGYAAARTYAQQAPTDCIDMGKAGFPGDCFVSGATDLDGSSGGMEQIEPGEAGTDRFFGPNLTPGEDPSAIKVITRTGEGPNVAGLAEGGPGPAALTDWQQVYP